MQSRPEMTSTPWRRGPFLLRPRGPVFGQTYEDSAIELRVFKPQSRVFAIAGAGCTALSLAAAGHFVTAVDINTRQLEYARLRAGGEPARRGVVEHLLAFGRNLARLAGWSQSRLTHFLSLSDGSEQTEYWDRWLDTSMWRALVDALLAPRLLGLFYSGPFVDALPRNFGERIRQRLRRGWSRHANRSNPHAAALLLGHALAECGHSISPINFVCADAAEFLENSPVAFDAFALSNISDGASLTYQRRLRAAVERAAAPGAVLVTRSFAEPVSGAGGNWAANWAILDRSLLWGVVEVSRVDGSNAGDPPCSIG
jgi:S-adenosylmethionine:diacylglycerol 3-amino-3-carboxypropyl transferase